jgi:hypothetical protein
MAANKAQFLGVFADDAEAIAFVQSQHWDAGKGDNNPWVGMFYAKSTTGEIRVWDGLGWRTSFAGETTFRVDPTDADAFQTVEAAYAAADASLPAGTPVVIVVAMNQVHTVNLTLDGSRNVAIKCESYFGSNYQTTTIIEGTITLQTPAGNPMLLLENVQSGNAGSNLSISQDGNWVVTHDGCLVNGLVITRTHGAQDCRTYFLRCTTNDQSVRITDTDAGTFFKHLYMYDCDFGWFGGTAFTHVGHVGFQAIKSNFSLLCFGQDTTLVDFGALTPNGGLRLRNVSISVTCLAGSTAFVAKNHNNGELHYEDTRIVTYDANSVIDAGGNIGSHRNAPHISSLTAPNNPVSGMGWRDLTTFNNVIWNGAAWV